jgi:hypothetical protein
MMNWDKFRIHPFIIFHWQRNYSQKYDYIDTQQLESLIKKRHDLFIEVVRARMTNVNTDEER